VTNASGPAICDGSATAVVYGGTPPYTYSWTGGGVIMTTATITDLCPGTYTVAVMDATGLAFTATATILGGTPAIYGCMDPLALNYNPDATIDDGSCYYGSDSTYIFGCTDPMSTNYNPYATIDDGSCYYTGDSTGIYGCTDSSSLNYNPYATIDDGSCVYDYTGATIDTCITFIDSVYISDYDVVDSAGMIVYWTILADGTVITIPVEYVIDGEGLYFVVLSIYCFEGKSTNEIFAQVLDVDYATMSANEISKPVSVNVYPNPSDGSFTIDLDNLAKNSSIEIMNTCGQVIYSANGSEEFNQEIDLTSQPKGMYFLRITDNNSTKVQKLIFR